MKKILFIISLFPVLSLAQPPTPPGLTKINQRYDWLTGKFGSLTLPTGPATPTTYGGPLLKGNVFVDSVGKKLRIYDGTMWRTYTDSVYVPAGDSVLHVRYGTTDLTVGTFHAGGGGGGSSGKINALIAADNTNTINNLDFLQTWNWNSLATTGNGSGLKLASSSTATVSNSVANITRTGAGTGAISNIGQDINVTSTGASLTNIGLRASASGATAGNVAAWFTVGNVGIGSGTPSSKAALDVNSTTQGFLAPRMNTTQQNAISSPATGLLIYNNDSSKFRYYDGAAWQSLSTGGAAGASVVTTLPIINKAPVANGLSINVPLIQDGGSSGNLGIYDLNKINSNWILSTYTDGTMSFNQNDSIIWTCGGIISSVPSTDTIRKSTDDGVTFTAQSVKLPYQMHTVAHLHALDGYFYFFGDDYGGTSTQQKTVFRTADFQTFDTRTTTAAWAARVLSAAWEWNGNLRVGGGQSDITGGATLYNNIYESTDGGTSWTQIVAQALASNGDTVMSGNAYNCVIPFNRAIYKIFRNVYPSGFSAKCYKSLDGGLSWKKISDYPLSPVSYPSTAVWDGKLWVFNGFDATNNTARIVYLDKTDQWHVYYNNRGIDPADSITKTHAADMIVYKDHLLEIAGNVRNDVWSLFRSNRTQSQIIRDSVYLDGFQRVKTRGYISQILNSTNMLFGRNLVVGSANNKIKRPINDGNGTGISFTLSEGIHFLDVSSAVGSDVDEYTNSKMHLKNGELVISTNPTYDQGSYTFQNDGALFNSGSINSSFYASANNRLATWKSSGVMDYTSFFETGGSSLGIGAVPDASARLDITSTTQGFLAPRMNTTNQNAIAAPATGLLIFNTDSLLFRFYNGSAWTTLGGGGSGGSPAWTSITGKPNSGLFIYASPASQQTGSTFIDIDQYIKLGQYAKIGVSTFGAAGTGALYTTAADGLTITAKTGSGTDLAILAASGSSILDNPTGTQNLHFYGNATHDAQVHFASFINFTGNSTFGAASQGSIYRDASADGLAVIGYAGGTNEFLLANHSGATALRIPAGTANIVFGARAVKTQGADVGSLSGAIALGNDGNTFEITGTNAITLISNLGWQNGAEINLIFTSTASLTDGTANSGTDIGFELAGNINFTASADDMITLVLCEIGGTQRWREKSRSVN